MYSFSSRHTLLKRLKLIERTQEDFQECLFLRLKIMRRLVKEVSDVLQADFLEASDFYPTQDLLTFGSLWSKTCEHAMLFLDRLNKAVKHVQLDRFDFALTTLRSEHFQTKRTNIDARRAYATGSLDELLDTVRHYRHHLKKKNKDAQRLFLRKAIELTYLLDEELQLMRRGAFLDVRNLKDAKEKLKPFRKRIRIISHKSLIDFAKVAVATLSILISSAKAMADYGHEAAFREEHAMRATAIRQQESKLDSQKRYLEELQRLYNELVGVYNTSTSLRQELKPELDGLNERLKKGIAEYNSVLEKHESSVVDLNSFATNKARWLGTKRKEVYDLAQKFIQKKVEKGELEVIDSGGKKYIRTRFVTLKRKHTFDVDLQSYLKDCFRSSTKGNQIDEFLKEHGKAPFLKELARSIRAESGILGDSLQDRVKIAEYLVGILRKNFTYISDGTTAERPYTPYMTPLESKSWGVWKSPSQFLVDGGGDCDEFSNFAAILLNHMGIETYFVAGDTHAVVMIVGEGKFSGGYEVNDKVVVLFDPQNGKIWKWNDLKVRLVYDIHGRVFWKKK